MPQSAAKLLGKPSVAARNEVDDYRTTITSVDSSLLIYPAPIESIVEIVTSTGLGVLA
jgi:hypothetical protein